MKRYWAIFEIFFSFLRYHKIGATDQRKFDLIIPFLLTLATLGSVAYVEEVRNINIAFLAEKGVIDRISTFLQFIAGFYITSLSAVVALDGEGKVMGRSIRNDKNEYTKLVPIGGTKPQEIKITFKVFLSYMFGYLTCTSFLLFLSSLFVLTFGQSIIDNLSLTWAYAAKYLFLFFFFGGFIGILCTTIYGVYFMVERLNYEG